MKITKVTLTGADDSVDPEALLDLSIRFPFAEWGILLSASSQGKSRFPSAVWLNTLAELALNSPLALSGHLCGRWVREILKGELHIPSIGQIWHRLQRVQINTHGELHEYDPAGFVSNISQHLDKEYIFQYDEVNTDMILGMPDLIPKASTLFDLSHGTGILPKEWPQPFEWILSGYAGGLSPDNVEEHIIKLMAMGGAPDTWIDMETHLRSSQDTIFDLAKCEQVLLLCEPYINKAAFRL